MLMPPPTLAIAEYAKDCRGEIEAVLARHGHEAGHYTVLGPDPWQVVWNDERTGFASFLEARHCMLGWRSPVGRDEDVPALVVRLVDCAALAGKPLFLIEVNELVKRTGDLLGLTPLWTGAESFIDLSTWSLAGGRRQKVRWAQSHAKKVGVTWREAFPLRDTADRLSLATVERLWKEERSERQTDSFLRTDFLEIASFRRYFVAEWEGRVVASVTCSPVNERGWYIQDPVRCPDAPRGALEGAMIEALNAFSSDGYEFASNGPLPFWQPDDVYVDAGDQLGTIGNRVLKFFDSQFRFRGINQFRSKFEPDRTSSLYVLRTRKMITVGIGRSLTQLLNKRSGTWALGADDEESAARRWQLAD